MPEGLYQIHDLLLIRLSGPAGQFAKVDKEYAYYRTPTAPAGRPVDIDFDLHPFSPPSLVEAQTVDKKYRVDDRTLFAADRYKVAFWKTALDGLDQRETRVRFAGNRWSMVIVVKLFLEPLIRLKVTLSGKAMVHSSCLTDGTRGFVLAASPSTGKTTTLLNWLSAGHPFVSDEYTILDDDGAWGYVTPFRFHAHNLTMNPILANIPDSAKRQIRLRTALLKVSGGDADVTYNIGVREALPQVAISDRAPWTSLMVITRADAPAPRVRTDRRDEVIRKLQVINHFELRQFAQYMNAWTYVHPPSVIARYFDIERENLARVLASRPCYEVNVPTNYTRQTYDQLIELLYRLDQA